MFESKKNFVWYLAIIAFAMTGLLLGLAGKASALEVGSVRNDCRYLGVTNLYKQPGDSLSMYDVFGNKNRFHEFRCKRGKNDRLRVIKIRGNTHDEYLALRSLAKEKGKGTGFHTMVCRNGHKSVFIGLEAQMNPRMRGVNYTEVMRWGPWTKRFAKKHDCKRWS